MSRTTSELDSLEQHLRDAFGRADLPAAPGRLHAEVAALPARSRNDRATTGRTGIRGRRRSSVLAALVAAAATLAILAIGLPMVLVTPNGGHESPTAGQSTATPTASLAATPTQPGLSSPSAGPTFATNVGPAHAWSAITWTEADTKPFSGVGNQYIFGGTAWSGGYVLVGEVYASSTGATGEIWSSSDGLNWQLIPDRGGTFASSQIQAVAARGSTLVAVGGSPTNDQSQAARPSALVWNSSDGIDWNRETGTGSIGSQFNLEGVVAASDGFIAYGSDWTDGSTAILFSTDGLAWDRVADTDGVFVGGDIRSMMATGEGFVAIGYDSQQWAPASPLTVAITPPHGAEWWSSDGRSWHKSPIGAGAYDFQSVQPWLNGTIRALGTGPSCAACVGPLTGWFSSDGGRTWLAKTSVNPTYAWSVVVDNQVFQIDQTLVATRSADGQTWNAVPMAGPIPPSQSYLQIANGRTLIVTAPSLSHTVVYVGTLR